MVSEGITRTSRGNARTAREAPEHEKTGPQFGPDNCTRCAACRRTNRGCRRTADNPGNLPVGQGRRPAAQRQGRAGDPACRRPRRAAGWRAGGRHRHDPSRADALDGKTARSAEQGGTGAALKEHAQGASRPQATASVASGQRTGPGTYPGHPEGSVRDNGRKPKAPGSRPARSSKGSEQDGAETPRPTARRAGRAWLEETPGGRRSREEARHGGSGRSSAACSRRAKAAGKRQGRRASGEAAQDDLAIARSSRSGKPIDSGL